MISIFKNSLLIFLFFTPFSIFSQEVEISRIPQIIQDFKNDDRGPFLDIKWFCDNGTIRDSKDPCPDAIGGNQHARYKDITNRLHKDNKLYFSKILTGSKQEDFWKYEENYDPIKQYLLNKYLENVDDGWILRKAQFYRGAIQSEDEIEWANDFFVWVLASDTRLKDNFLLIRQAAKTIPHREETKTGNNVRAISKSISDKKASFMAIRTKIHSNPEFEDIALVKNYLETNKSKLIKPFQDELNKLIQEMEVMFRPKETSDILPLLKKIPASDTKTKLEAFAKIFEKSNNPSLRYQNASELLEELRIKMLDFKGGKARLDALDISIFLEEMIINDILATEFNNIYDISNALCYLNQAVTGCGYIENWENARTSNANQLHTEKISEADLAETISHHTRVTQWSASYFNTLFIDNVNQYAKFEPLAKSFIDDQIRSTLLLLYGNMVGDLSLIQAKYSDGGNQVFSIPNQEQMRGLNPGFAKGKLVIVEDLEKIKEFDPNQIYIFKFPPAELSPVKGILTVNEGNMISHVQLLARNLGIPNTVISENNIKSLEKYDGKEVFYAVSLAGDVIMKDAKDMNSSEKNLFEEKVRSNEKVTVETDRINLKRDSLLNIRDLSGKDSGISCGPKAANLAQLKQIFPEHVVEGFVVPFGVYRNHMDQKMSTRNMTYWQFINQIFIDKNRMLKNGIDEKEVECIVLEELEILRNNIKSIELNNSLKIQIKNNFISIFGKEIGQVPVFLRSDTNMEDLKDFTGAGLNLTKFNILNEEEIYQGIRDVWASPFTERSYKWRQSYLNNPENVYPSILVIPSVNVDYSGVIISKDIYNAAPFSLTVAFSRGVGGAVDGQKAETYIIQNGKTPLLLNPARETSFKTIPPTGGTIVLSTSLVDPILNNQNIMDMHAIVKKVMIEMPARTDMEGPYDIELGFLENKIWLFQIRPFVENKSALSNDYLQSISQFPSTKKTIDIYKSI